MHWTFQTAKGEFSIVPIDDGWHPMFSGEKLGWYERPEQAASELAGGVTHWPAGVDPGKLGIPEELSDWEKHS